MHAAMGAARCAARADTGGEGAQWGRRTPAWYNSALDAGGWVQGRHRITNERGSRHCTAVSKRDGTTCTHNSALVIDVLMQLILSR